jgi:hypothetical protein
MNGESRGRLPMASILPVAMIGLRHVRHPAAYDRISGPHVGEKAGEHWRQIVGRRMYSLRQGDAGIGTVNPNPIQAEVCNMVSRKDLRAGAAAVPGVRLTEPAAETVPVRVGLAWYRREDYPLILEVMADRREMHCTYDEWLREVEHLEQHLVSEGRTVEHVVIDPERFRAWCDQHNLKPVAKARSRFVAEAGRAMGDDRLA